MDGKNRKNIKHLAGKKIVTLSGIAQPDGFRKMLENLNGKILSNIEFADHHNYKNNDVKKILKKKDEKKPDYIITTEKDAVKLRPFNELKNYVWVLEIEVQPDKYWNTFFESFLETL